MLAGVAGGGQLGAEAEASTEGDAEHSRGADLQEAGDVGCGITLDIHEKKDETLGGRQPANGLFEFRAQNVVAGSKVAGIGWRKLIVAAQDLVVGELANQGGIDDGAIGLGGGAEGADKGAAQDIFGLDFVAGHIAGKREDAMAMAVVDIPLPVLQALGGHLAGGESGGVLLKFKQHERSRGQKATAGN